MNNTRNCDRLLPFRLNQKEDFTGTATENRPMAFIYVIGGCHELVLRERFICGRITHISAQKVGIELNRYDRNPMAIYGSHKRGLSVSCEENKTVIMRASGRIREERGNYRVWRIFLRRCCRECICNLRPSLHGVYRE